MTLKKAGFSTKLLFEYKGFILSAAVLSSRVTLDVNIKSFFLFSRSQLLYGKEKPFKNIFTKTLRT